MPIRTNEHKIKLMCSGKKVKKIMCQNKIVYSSGNNVVYHITDSLSYTEEYTSDESCLSPKSFNPTGLVGDDWTFIGWREDKTANATVLTSKVMGDEVIHLYAVYSYAVTLSYAGNGNTGGSTTAQTGYRYYNNGNIANPSFTLKSNEFTKTDYSFVKWALSSASGTQYSAGASVTLSSNDTFYAVWKLSAISGTASTWNYKSVSLSGWSDKQYCYYYSPSWICGFYSTAYDLTNVKSLTFTVSTKLSNSGTNKYYYNVVDVLAGVAKSTANTNASFAKSASKVRVVGHGYNMDGTYTTTLTVDVSSLSGTYYVGAAYRAYNDVDGAVSKWNNYGGYFDCTSTITNMIVA